MGTAALKRPRVLHTAKDFRTAIALLDALVEKNPRKGSREFEQLELLTLLVQDYEDRNVPEPPVPTPQAMVQFMLEQKGLTRAALAEPFGGRSRVSDFFSRKRSLSMSQIKALRDLLGIPADVLIT